MDFTFASDLPNGYDHKKVILISGIESLQFTNHEYLILRDGSNVSVFQINFEYHCSPFKEALLINDILAVGHEGRFYLYNLAGNFNYLNLEMDGYFGHLDYHEKRFYIGDACGISCLEKNGTLLWRNDKLGIDGVTIERFEENTLFGSGEWDPPGGWKSFILDIKTGDQIS